MPSLDLVRSALFLPASNPRAIEKARGLACDMAILDLEDAVPDDAKESGRDAAVAAARDWAGPLLAVRINGFDSVWHGADVTALTGAPVTAIVVPKVEEVAQLVALAARLGRPILAMIETPAGIYAAREIAAAPGVAGLIAGSNDLAASLRLPADSGRSGITLALQTIVLAARAAGIVAFDGVYNRLDDSTGLEADCAAGRVSGFDGKTLIHPSHIDAANRLFGPSPKEVEEAEALVAAATGGAERFRGRMIEAMHVAASKEILARAVLARGR